MSEIDPEDDFRPVPATEDGWDDDEVDDDVPDCYAEPELPPV